MSFSVPKGVEATGYVVGGPPVSGRMSEKPLLENGWDTGNGSAEVCYHDDGPVGTAVRFMGRDARLDVDGEPLGNVLGRLASDVFWGRRTAAEGLGEIKGLRDRMPERSRARAELDSAIREVDGPSSPVPAVPAGTPEPLRTLVKELHAVPLVRADPGRELHPLLSLLDEFAAGRLGGVRLIIKVTELANRRHESYGDSGKFEIDRAVGNAAYALSGLPREAIMRPEGRSAKESS